MTDRWTSFGVVVGLVLVILTQWRPFDPLLAIAVALNILWSGGHLIWRSAQGLLDYSDPNAGHQMREKLDTICSELGVGYHGVRFRTTGYRQLIEVHLLFPRDSPLGDAHRLATVVEEHLPAELAMPAEVITHLESQEDHKKSTPRHITAACRSNFRSRFEVHLADAAASVTRRRGRVDGCSAPGSG